MRTVTAELTELKKQLQVSFKSSKYKMFGKVRNFVRVKSRNPDDKNQSIIAEL